MNNILKFETKLLFLFKFSTKYAVMNLMIEKLPNECKSKEEIREQIDIIDKEIILLFAKRFEYVSEIVKYKNDPESVVASDRKNHVIAQRGIWAEEMGLDKKTFEDIYRCLINNNIEKEMEILEQRKLVKK